jgi:demethylmenaquinone methyltransferase / 2-methoxy-6-polyprenyl-1,4-benzoquinol methylase
MVLVVTDDPTWTNDKLRNPHAVVDKQQRVREMFAAIAPKYDLNNRLHSFGRDQAWRRRAVKLAELRADDVVVDVACGTGDLTVAFERHRLTLAGGTGEGARTIGIDYTLEMLPIAQHKVASDRSKHVVATFLNGDAQSLPLPDASCDVVSIAFGIRNVQDPARAIAEFRRILRPGGRLIVLEFSQPSNRLIRWCNDLYCARIMPHTATWIAGDKSGAYKYLPMSVKTFMDRRTMVRLMQDAGFVDVTEHPMTFGVCVAYRGRVGPTSTARVG